jgi:Flp pilus assembly protein protease CpaA
VTTELTLLLAITVFIVMGTLFGDRGPQRVFFNSAPRLAARVEAQLATGRGFTIKNGAVVRWEEPPQDSVQGAR